MSVISEAAALDTSCVPKSHHRTLKDLRACIYCRRIKSYAQFLETGCENCSGMVKSRADEWTSANFDGFISLIEPTKSWAGRWHGMGALLPGCYAIKVHGGQEEAQDGMEEDAPDEDDRNFIAEDEGEGDAVQSSVGGESIL
eukprot:GGOE01036624.1.p1 GENE.GGOE01036624.1~~GGOE01036624.1.p1  ORF type:complete len:142 (-),score=49.75 GGOE01036624.1:207-632(-)